MGVGSWLARKRDHRRSLLARRDIHEFLIRLRGLNSGELGLVAAQAADFCRFSYERGVDLRWPALALQIQPGLERQLEHAVLKGQRDGQEASLPGPMVWAHTLRATNRLELMADAKEMWRIVERGFDRAQLAAIDFNFVMRGALILSVRPEFLVVPKDFGTD